MEKRGAIVFQKGLLSIIFLMLKLLKEDLSEDLNSFLQ